MTNILNGSFIGFAASNKGETLAVVERTEFYAPAEDRPLLHLEEPFKHDVLIVDLRNVGKIRALHTANVINHSLHWSPSAKAIAFVTYDWYSQEPACVISANVDSGRETVHFCDSIGEVPGYASAQGAIEPFFRYAQFNWTANDELALRVEANQTARGAGWYLLRGDSLGSKLTQGLLEVADQLFAAGKRTFVLAGANLWEIGSGQQPDNQTAWCECKINSIEAAAANKTGGVEVRASLRNEETQVLLDLQRHRVIQRLETPVEHTLFGSYMDPKRTVGILGSRGKIEIAVSTGFEPKSQERRIEFARWIDSTNRFGSVTSFSYTTSSGQHLEARLVLPENFSRAKHYPTIVLVYPGTIERPISASQKAQFDNYTGSEWEDAAQYASEGYVAIEPSSPVAEGSGREGRLLDELTDDTVSAVNEAVRLGFTDPARVGVVGHSYGGYMVLGLVTRTDIFRAAVALAGPSDLSSFYGVFGPAGEYGRSDEWWEPFDLSRMSGNEADFLNQQTTPWKDPDIYRENSPYFALDRIHTPLMIVQGDQDGIPVEQGEEIFTGLLRLGRRADFVRYQGEGHIIRGRSDQIDLMERVNAWFGEYLNKRQ